ncbi:MAG: sigma-70 family RNA polymerase sigma factor [Chloroflexi bacterium]|nr:sigma-70 family RNA polymerase sigma factor [Chloroflexota bacterium]
MSSVSLYAGAERRANVGLVPHGKERRAAGRAVERERELVFQATKHNHAAFGQLYDRYIDKIYRYIYYKVGNQTEAEDLSGQVFLKAWEAIGHYQCTGRPFAAWLYRIAHNLVVDYFRTKRDAASLEEITTLIEPNSDLDDIVEQHLTSETLRHALRRLTRDQQQVIVLRFLEGYNTTEVAQIMGKQPGAIRTLQHRALAGLNGVFRRGVERL